MTQCSQLCDLPAASLNDQLPQHTFRVVWTAGDVQKECVLLKGDATCSPPPPPPPPLTGVPLLHLLFLPGHHEGWSRDSATDEQLFR